MKKSLLAIAALTAFAGAAQAQSSVTVYGLLDVGVMGQSNSNNLNGSTSGTSAGLGGSGSASYPRNGNSFGFMSGGQSGNRLGFKGQEDLGGGTKAIFLLEQGFSTYSGANPNTGLQGNGSTTTGMGNGSNTGDSSLQGQLFDRGAYAGLSNDKYGTLTFGRQNTLMLDNIGGYDPVNAQQFDPLAFSGQFGGGGYTDNGRANGAIKYKTKVMGVNVGALYAPGGFAGNTSVGTRLEGNIGYETAKWGVQVLNSYQEGATSMSGVTAGAAIAGGAGKYLPNGSTAPSSAVAVTIANTSSTQLTAKYSPVDKLWLMAGMQYAYYGTPSNMQYYAGAPVTQTGINVAYYQALLVPVTKNTFWFGGNYMITPAVKGSLGYYQQNVNQSSATALAGKTTYITAMAEYYMSKRTNLYAAASQVNFNGSAGGIASYSNTNIAPTTVNQQFTYGLGMRHTF